MNIKTTTIMTMTFGAMMICSRLDAMHVRHLLNKQNIARTIAAASIPHRTLSEQNNKNDHLRDNHIFPKPQDGINILKDPKAPANYWYSNFIKEHGKHFYNLASPEEKIAIQQTINELTDSEKENLRAIRQAQLAATSGAVVLSTLSVMHCLKSGRLFTAAAIMATSFYLTAFALVCTDDAFADPYVTNLEFKRWIEKTEQKNLEIAHIKQWSDKSERK